MSTQTQELQNQRLIWEVTKSHLCAEVEESNDIIVQSTKNLRQAQSTLQEIDVRIEEEVELMKNEEEKQQIQQEKELQLTMQLGAANELSNRLHSEYSLVKEQNQNFENEIQKADEKLKSLNDATRLFEKSAVKCLK